MKPSTPPPAFAVKWIVLLLLIVVVVVVMVPAFRRTPAPASPPTVSPNQPVATVPNLPVPPGGTNLVKTTPLPVGLTNNVGFQLRPFPTAYESSNIQWTMADGKDTNVIRQLAHNAMEYDRMVEENARIFRRQLVYLKRTAAAVFEDAKLTGQPVRELTLPGVDGQELQFEIVQSDSDGSSRHGMFSGHLAGNSDSMVTLAFQDGREAYTVLSAKQDIFVVGEPREPGQVIVKAIDPNTYGAGPANPDAADFIKTEPAK